MDQESPTYTPVNRINGAAVTRLNQEALPEEMLKPWTPPTQEDIEALMREQADKARLMMSQLG